MAVAFTVGVLAGGCDAAPPSPSVAFSPPPGADFFGYVRGAGAVFTPALRGPRDMTAEQAIDTVRGKRKRHPAFTRDAPLGPPVFGIIRCPDVATCRDAFGVQDGTTALDVWVIRSVAPAGPDAGSWIAVNAVTEYYSVSGSP